LYLSDLLFYIKQFTSFKRLANIHKKLDLKREKLIFSAEKSSCLNFENKKRVQSKKYCTLF